MTNEFSTLEIQLIRSSLATKSDDEIAEVLERHVDDVREKINELTGGGADQRSKFIAEFKVQQEQEKLANKKKKTGRPVNDRKVIEAAYEKKISKKTGTIEFKQAQRRKEVEAMAVNRKFKTRHVDYSTMKSVRVNRNTHVWVPKEMPESEAIKQYQKNIETYNRTFLPSH